MSRFSAVQSSIVQTALDGSSGDVEIQLTSDFGADKRGLLFKSLTILLLELKKLFISFTKLKIEFYRFLFLAFGRPRGFYFRMFYTIVNLDNTALEER